MLEEFDCRCCQQKSAPRANRPGQRQEFLGYRATEAAATMREENDHRANENIIAVRLDAAKPNCLTVRCDKAEEGSPRLPTIQP